MPSPSPRFWHRPVARLSRRPALVGVLAGLLGLAPEVALAGTSDVGPGIDLFTTPGTGATFDDLSLPADFFDPGSDPFTGRVVLQGSPLPNLGGKGAPELGPTDTIVKRNETAQLPNVGDQDTIPIEIVALNLVSIQPITVTYVGGASPESWNVAVCLSSATIQPVGSMTVRRDCAVGGTFDATLPVLPKLIFQRPSDSAIRVLDFGQLAIPPIQFQATDARWVYTPDHGLNVLLVQQGANTDGNCDGAPDGALFGSSNFVPGVWTTDCECDPPPGEPIQVKRMTFEEALLAQHGVLPAQEPPPDTDGDGVGDDADNCPEAPNPLQEDSDDDGNGDLCDNCPATTNTCQDDTDPCGLAFIDHETGDTSQWSACVGDGCV
jgi:hypothetical protein